MGRPLVMAKSTLERTVFSPPPKNIPLFSHDYSCATFARRVSQYTTPDKWKSSRWTGKNASKFFHVNNLTQSLRTRGNWKSRFQKRTAMGTVMFSVLLQLPQRLSLIEFNFYDFFSHCSSNQITALILKYQLFFVLSHFSFHRLPDEVFYVKGWDRICHAM